MFVRAQELQLSVVVYVCTCSRVATISSDVCFVRAQEWQLSVVMYVLYVLKSGNYQ